MAEVDTVVEVACAAVELNPVVSVEGIVVDTEVVDEAIPHTSQISCSHEGHSGEVQAVG